MFALELVEASDSEWGAQATGYILSPQNAVRQMIMVAVRYRSPEATFDAVFVVGNHTTFA